MSASGASMSVAEQGVQRILMSWEDYLALPDDVRAEWVDGEAVVSPPPSRLHGRLVARLSHPLLEALPDLDVIAESGLRLGRDRLRGPDLMVLAQVSDTTWVEDAPLVVVEVLSPSTRAEDLLRKVPEYAEAGIGQYWTLDPELGVLDVRAIGDHRTVILDLGAIIGS